MRLAIARIALVVVGVGCSSSSVAPAESPDASTAPPPDAASTPLDAPVGAPVDGEPPDARGDAHAPDAHVPDAAPPSVDKAAPCASVFGSALTSAFGRLDGTVVAVVPPNDQACTLPNMTHLVVQVMMQGAVYRLVVDVLSNQGSPDVLFYETDAALAAGPWSEGWHAGAALDYVTTLKVQSGSFKPMVQKDLVTKITGEIELGAHISIFATSAGQPNSAHLVHRNLTDADGAIVVNPESATPHYLLLRFDEQSF